MVSGPWVSEDDSVGLVRGLTVATSMTTTLHSLAVEQVGIDSLHPDLANPRRISEDDLDALTRSIRA